MTARIHRLITLALLALATSGLAGTEGYPIFSWDRVPVYAHCSYSPESLTPENFDFLARHFNLITFAAGMKEDVEGGLARGAAEIKKRNPNAKVLFYFAGDCLHSPFTRSNRLFPQDGFLEPPAGGKVVDPQTGRIVISGKWYFDKSRADVQEWWSTVAGKAVTQYGCDGVFADGLGSYGQAKLSPERKAALEAGTFAMCRLAREKMGPRGLILFNPLHGQGNAQFLHVTDGAMIDRFDRTLFSAAEVKPARAAANLNMMGEDIEAMQAASRAGKIVIFKGWPGFHQKDKELMKKPHAELVRMAQEAITFPLASFLIAAGPNCYFQYTWGWRPDCGTLDWYPEFDKPLGPPKGDAVRDGWKYTRQFEHATVFVDLEAQTGKIDWQ